MNDNFNPSCAKVVEAGQIGYRLAEEVMSLRKELLALKENKRTLLISNQNLEGDLLSSRKIILSLQSQLSKDHIELSKKVSRYFSLICLFTVTSSVSLISDFKN